MSDWVATVEASSMRLTERFQLLLRVACLAGLICYAFVSSSAQAEQGSHITLDEPLPQPAWELPLIANGEGTVTDSTYPVSYTHLRAHETS